MSIKILSVLFMLSNRISKEMEKRKKLKCPNILIDFTVLSLIVVYEVD